MPKTVNAVPAAFSGPVVASVAPLMEPVKATGLNDEMVPVTPLLVTAATKFLTSHLHILA